ncbi:MAG: GyrI-like domain-containing protein, partial [Lachnospiraceae bacterium]|nr:GyrI-like domain-containing protein [Lachnospiraceae bacterium]
IDDIGGGKFRYLVAGKYTGGSVPEGMVVYEFPRSDWAVFNCIGPIPEALQSMNTRIFREWLYGLIPRYLFFSLHRYPDRAVVVGIGFFMGSSVK